MYQSPVIESQGISRLLLKNLVQIAHRIPVVTLLIMHQCPVEICESIGCIKTYRLVHVSYGGAVIFHRGMQTPPAHIPLRVETVQLDGLVIICHCLECVT